MLCSCFPVKVIMSLKFCCPSYPTPSTLGQLLRSLLAGVVVQISTMYRCLQLQGSQQDDDTLGYYSPAIYQPRHDMTQGEYVLFPLYTPPPSSSTTTHEPASTYTRSKVSDNDHCFAPRFTADATEHAGIATDYKLSTNWESMVREQSSYCVDPGFSQYSVGMYDENLGEAENIGTSEGPSYPETAALFHLTGLAYEENKTDQFSPLEPGGYPVPGILHRAEPELPWLPMIVVSQPKQCPKRKYMTPLACFFCRKRKIQCGGPSQVCGLNESPSCPQCARRRRRCIFPTESNRGKRPIKPANFA